MTLLSYLSQLNSADQNQYIWVNPDDINDYKISQWSLSGRVNIGSLDNLSFGFQSMTEAIKNWLDNQKIDRKKATFRYHGNKVTVAVRGIMDAYQSEALDKEFKEFLENEALDILSTWAEFEAENFINDNLPDILAQAKEDKETFASSQY